MIMRHFKGMLKKSMKSKRLNGSLNTRRIEMKKRSKKEVFKMIVAGDSCQLTGRKNYPAFAAKLLEQAMPRIGILRKLIIITLSHSNAPNVLKASNEGNIYKTTLIACMINLPVLTAFIAVKSLAPSQIT